jgi:hypothetical protein
VPTALRRIQVTLTPEVDHALEVAAAEWPDAPLSELLAKLAVEAASRREDERSARREARRAALRATQGTFDYPPDHLEKLREDWPE